ncbi:glycosyltransferase [Paenibacillus physcomitrellae]|uniref:Rhamnosyl transferase n=1 Tax=Paenibacillus physcomitrellae TaxID=1619311 RepID=A0ABQ1FV55_9BACL|nr:glycosyltransferase [Paenibacillus physcomitrellae]GGA31661.1 hypothetical protein GCM10010917_15990 [Paenibacillus physcomitrellae]
MDRKVIIEINFNNYGMDPHRLERGWIEHRLGIFRKFTLRSLQAQTNQDFLVVVRIAKESKDLIREILAKQSPFPSHIRFGTIAESDKAILAFAKGHKQLYIARLDSDDLYHRTYVQQLYQVQPKPDTLVLINQNGYLWDSDYNEMAPIFYRSPQFYVFLYKTDEYAAGYRIKPIGGKGHGYVINLPHEFLLPRNFVNVVHSSNTSIKKVPRNNQLSTNEVAKVLREFMI